MDVEQVVNPYGVPASPLDRDEADDLPGLLVRGEWSPEIGDYMRRRDIQALYLNSARGWRGHDYAFLRELPGLRLLNVIAPACEDLSVVGEMTALEKLSITCPTRQPVDFSALSALRSCALHWWPGARSILRCRALRILYLDGVRQADLDGLGELAHLHKLTIASSNLASLAPLSELGGLEKLELLNCRRLSDLEGLERFSGLRWLAIDGSTGIHDFSRVAALPKLEVLNLSDSGRIRSLAPLRRLTKLRALAFAGQRTLVEDGDLSPLEELPQLSMLMFAARRHYTHDLVKAWDWQDFYRPDRLLRSRTAGR